MIEELFDRIDRLNPAARWLAYFALLFASVFAIFMVLGTPLAMAGEITVDDLVGFTVGLSFGTAAINATYAVLT